MCLGLMNEQWDIAILLDACRYDVFKEVYKKHLPLGTLEKKLGASDTLDWLHSVFEGNGVTDVMYVSAHPGINGVGVPWGRFNASEHFYKVCDAWLSAWNWNVGTSLPYEVAEVAVQAMSEHPGKKTIVHFMQPHFPYRQAPCPSTYSDLNSTRNNLKLGILLEKLLRKLMSSLELDFSKLRTTYWKTKKILSLSFLEDLNEIYWRNYAIEDLKSFYRDNLEWVLESVAGIIEKFGEARIIITSDHGEAFGENGEFFHVYKTRNPVVRYVPFWRAC